MMVTQKNGYIELQENARALNAWGCVNRVKEKHDSFKKQYRSCVLNLPVMILTNGLGQTLAFLKSKGKGDKNSAHEQVYIDMQGWLFSKESKIHWSDLADNALIERIIKVHSDTYRHITTETLAYLNWLKRFTEAALKES